MPLKFPPIYLLKSFLKVDELHKLAKQIDPVYNLEEAELILGNIKTAKRAAHDLRTLKLFTEEVVSKGKINDTSEAENERRTRPKKKQRVNKDKDGKDVITLDSSTESEGQTDTEVASKPRKTPSNGRISATVSLGEPASAIRNASTKPNRSHGTKKDTVKVLKLSWYTDSVTAGKLLPIEDYLIYEGRITGEPQHTKPDKQKNPSHALSRMKAEAPPMEKSHHRNKPSKSQSQGSQASTRPPRLLHETTSEHDIVANLPPVPAYLHSKYSCERPTPLHCVNDEFLSQLRIIRDAHILMGAEAVGHKFSDKAYSGGISTISAYPYKLKSAKEVLNLPNCGQKIAGLFQEWKNTGHLQEADDLQTDEKNQALILFTGIFDVGDTTARQFYKKGWRTIEDVIQYGWDTLHRGQQIGVKFYNEFQQRMSRKEVEKIANIVLDHAVKLRPGFQMVICGGYRKGKPDCGDVDVILSNPDEETTEGFLCPLLESLEESGHVTHTLKYSERTSERGQSPVSWKGGMKRSKSGFDSLDHMFVAWQDPDWPMKKADLKKNPNAENPNPHRRVDIIVTPWKTAGCAILGWSGGKAFEKDLRSFCRNKKGWKFDSSGVRSVANGTWIDLEKGGGDMLVKEKRVFEAIGLEWRDPIERCTD
ncbi:hypothetical protein G7Y89_g3 [Cudoniella acicularis]|uniref:DNA polymerase n=1 Tax=Cudoniella acicularis TaxID=354080 RepID=A0A8H4WBK3_9HELO|nr:hypothetical protein G7Y89_g3 [Cudoniella acicularis]